MQIIICILKTCVYFIIKRIESLKKKIFQKGDTVMSKMSLVMENPNTGIIKKASIGICP